MADTETPKKTRSKKSKSSSNSKTRLNNQDDEKLSGVRDRTKSRFDELLQQALVESEDLPLKKKKKQKAQSVLDNLRKGEGLAKSEDMTVQANIFDPDNHPKSTKSNMRREKQKSLEGQENTAFEDDDSIVKTEKKRKKPKTPDKTITMEMTVPLSQIPSVAKKKKKKKSRSQQSQLSQQSQAKDEVDDMTQTEEARRADEATQTGDEDEAYMSPGTRKKSRRPGGIDEAGDSSADLVEEREGRVIEEAPEHPDYSHISDEGRILGITIHKTDKLKTNYHMSHPMVRIHIVDMDTGHYLKKQTRSRNVTFFYESSNDNVDFIMPILTQPYDFKKNRSITPAWEEAIILNENFNFFTQEEPKVIVFFEVLDFVSMGQATSQFKIKKEDGGWHKVAWGFLKIRGANNILNTDRKVRLQLFYPFYSYRPMGSQVEVFQWWSKFERSNYPSTLYVTLKGIVPPQDVSAAERSMFPLQPEKGTVSFLDLKSFSAATNRIKKTKKEPAQWSRLPGQGCKIPNRIMLSLSAGRMGCFVVRFSPDGKRLACAGHDKAGYPIYIYEKFGNLDSDIPSGNLLGHLLGHYSIVYDLCWSRCSKWLLSASSDATARVWNMETVSPTAEKVLPHPSFVYSAQFHPRVVQIVATGGYDQSIRVWDTGIDGNQPQLVQELSGHTGYINSICFNDDGDKLFSGDSVGIIRVWNSYVTDQPSRRGVLKEWSSYKVIADEEIKGSNINFLCVHPSGRRLLIHSRDNAVRMMDLRIFSIMQRYLGGLNFREQLRSCMSPCGTFILAGSEDCTAYVWNAETGDQVAMYAELNYKHPVSDIHFHPHDHIVAFCSFGENHPVMLYKYDPQAAQKEMGIKTVVTKLFKPSGVQRAPDGTMIPDELLATSMDVTSTPKTMTTADFSLADSARKDRIIKKMNAVNAFISSSRPSSPTKAADTSFGNQSTMLNSTWGSTFDRTGDFLTTLQSRPLGTNVASVSPHAPATILSTMQRQQFASQMEYTRQSGAGWRPGFSAVGKQSTAHYGRPPQFSLDASQGKPQFSFIATPSKSVTANQHQVVALYDYQAQRSDELSIMRGDVINVLHKDSENWWMGELSDGQQGFFPANYITEKGTVDESGEEDARSEVSHEVVDSASSSPRRVTAVVSKGGDLKFISGAEESDSPKETPRKRKPKKKRKTGSQENLVELETTRRTRSSSRDRRRAKKSQESAA